MLLEGMLHCQHRCSPSALTSIRKRPFLPCLLPHRSWGTASGFMWWAPTLFLFFFILLVLLRSELPVAVLCSAMDNLPRSRAIIGDVAGSAFTQRHLCAWPRLSSWKQGSLKRKGVQSYVWNLTTFRAMQSLDTLQARLSPRGLCAILACMQCPNLARDPLKENWHDTCNFSLFFLH